MMRKILMAVPKGRILEDLKPLFSKIDLVPESDFFNSETRKLIFSTNKKNINLLQVRSFDVATFVKFGAADIGICGLDVLEEFSSREIFPVIDLKIGRCRLSIAAKNSLVNSANILTKKTSPEVFIDFLQNKSHIRVATKYTNIAQNYFSSLGIQVETVKLNGSIEIAPQLNLCDFILDLVSSGKTLEQNQMTEVKKILEVTSYLVVNRTSFKTVNHEINQLIKDFDVV